MKPALIALCLLIASPAVANPFSPACTASQRTIAQAFRHFDTAPVEVVMALGSMQMGKLVSEAVTGGGSSRVFREYQGSFRGHSATNTGFSHPFSTPVTIQQTCEGKVCYPSFDAGQWLVFLLKSGGGYVFTVRDGVCAPSGFASPSTADLELAIRCLNGNCR